MKKLIITFSLVFLLAGCTTIGEQYTEPKVKPGRHVEYHYHSIYYSCYIPYPVYGGFYFHWYPSYYGYYGYFRYYRNYPYQWRYRQGKKTSTSVITKKQLKARSSTASKTVVRKSSLTATPKNTAKGKSVVKKEKK